MNIWHSYGQKGGLFCALSVTFSNMVASGQAHEVHKRFLLVTLPNIHRFNKNFTGRLSNKPFLIWLLTTSPLLKCIATQHCNLSLITAFLTLEFHKAMRQYMLGLMGFLIMILMQIC